MARSELLVGALPTCTYAWAHLLQGELQCEQRRQLTAAMGAPLEAASRAAAGARRSTTRRVCAKCVLFRLPPYQIVPPWYGRRTTMGRQRVRSQACAVSAVTVPNVGRQRVSE